MFRNSCNAIVTLLASASALVAGPDEITSRLMDESVSMLDYGILRLQLSLDSNPKIGLAAANFDWERNVIEIGGYDIVDSADLEQARGLCQSWFDEIRASAGVDSSTGLLFMWNEASNFSQYFTHEGWSRTINGKTTTEIAQGIDSKFELVFSVHSISNEAGKLKSLSCSSRLIESGFATKEEWNPN